MSVGVGTTEYTVGSIMDRLFQTYLTPPDDQYAQVRLGTDITSTTVETIIIGGFTIPEDEALLRQGSILEVDQELLRVVSYDATAGSVEVTRGEYGTVPAVHNVPKLMNLNPPYTRASVFEAVSDNIITLFPKLFTVNTEYLGSVAGSVYPVNDDLAVEVVSAWVDGWNDVTDIMAEVVDYHAMAGGRAIVTNHAAGGSLWFRYRRRMAKPTDELTSLKDVGVDDRWVNIVMAGAAGDLMIGKDIPASQTEWVKSVLEAESIRVGTRMSIAGGLRQYRNTLLVDAQREMKAEYKTKVRMRNPMKSIA